MPLSLRRGEAVCLKMELAGAYSPAKLAVEE